MTNNTTTSLYSSVSNRAVELYEMILNWITDTWSKVTSWTTSNLTSLTMQVRVLLEESVEKFEELRVKMEASNLYIRYVDNMIWVVSK